MSDAAMLHAEQLAYWNGPGGAHWAEHRDRTDRVMAVIADRLLDRAAAQPGEIVLDIGCGAGVTSAALAARVAPSGRVIGLDVSEPLVARARSLYGAVPNLEFILGDAATTGLDAVSANLLVSRFGVMFFGDPVAAFRNLRRGLRTGGRVAFACWRKAEENAWMTVPVQAVHRHIPPLPRPAPHDPGPFAFADPDRVRGILDASGFGAIGIEPVDFTMDLAAGGGMDEALIFATEIGAASRALAGQSDAVRRAAILSIREALTPHLDGASVTLPAAIWIVTALAG